jgi:hypothetical protein
MVGSGRGARVSARHRVLRGFFRCILLLGAPLVTSGCNDLALPRIPSLARDSAAEPPGEKTSPGKRREEKRGDSLRTGSDADRFALVRKGLRRLVVAQETFFAENGAYNGDLSLIGFTSERNTTIRLLWVTPDGWAASGVHADLPGRDCVVFVGQVHAPPTTLKYVRQGREGVPVCDDSSRPTRTVASSPPAEPKPPAETLPDTGNALEAVNPRTLMKADLRSLVRSQETHFATQGVYARRTEPLALQYLWRPGVRIKILAADRQSWAAKATHPRLPGKSCVIWFGSVSERPVTDAQRRAGRGSGVPECDE